MLGSYNDEDIYLFRTDDPEGSDFTHRYQVQHHVLVASVIHPHVASLLSTLMLPLLSTLLIHPLLTRVMFSTLMLSLLSTLISPGSPEQRHSEGSQLLWP